VSATHYTEALAEAWRRYRELPYVDNEPPPAWTRPIFQAAVLRPNGERPSYTEDGHVHGLSPKAVQLGDDGERLFSGPTF
jgi:hypothetical protein